MDAFQPEGDTWGNFSSLGILRAVLDQNDILGVKNRLIDFIHKGALLSEIGFSKSSCVLDFGCGTGRICRWLSGKVKDVYGVDVTPEMIDVAGRLWNPGNISYALIDGVNLPYTNGLIDIVISIYVLQYVINREDLVRQILQNLYNILKPKGQFALIEQVSNVENTSGTVKHCISREIFREKLDEFFTVKKCIPIRLGARLSIIERASLISRVLPDVIINWYAVQTVKSVKKASSQELGSVSYYDCLFVCEKG